MATKKPIYYRRIVFMGGIKGDHYIYAGTLPMLYGYTKQRKDNVVFIDPEKRRDSLVGFHFRVRDLLYEPKENENYNVPVTITIKNIEELEEIIEKRLLDISR